MEYIILHHYYIKELHNSTIYWIIPLFQKIPYGGILC